MGRGSTDLDNYQYDNWLSENKKERELRQRTDERRHAHKPDMSGYHFGIDTKPVKVKDMQEFKQELAKRGLGLEHDKQTVSQYKSKLKYK